MFTELFFAGLIFLLCGTLLPLLAGSRDRNDVRTVSLVLTIIASAMLGVLSLVILPGSVPVAITAYAPAGLFSLGFVIDRLAAFFILIIAVVSACIALYSIEYVKHMAGGARRNLLCGCTNLFILAMVLVVASADTISFFLFWELMAAASFLLVMYEYDTPGTGRAGIFYFVMTHLSTLFVLFGIILLWLDAGTFAIAPLTGAPTLLTTLAFLSLFCGFSIKSGIIPSTSGSRTPTRQARRPSPR